MTIKEIAQMAGVSSAAVSRYLNGGYVAVEKRERIREVIEKTGYRPSAQARALRTKSGRLIGVVVPKISSESIGRVVAGVGQVLAECGYQMLLADTDNTPEKELEYLELFENYPVDGIILAGTVVTDRHRAFFRKAKVPVVVVGQEVAETSCVFHDDYHAGYEMGRYLAGRLRAGGSVGYVGVTRDDASAGAAREDGLAAGLAAGGAVLDRRLVERGAFTTGAGHRGACNLIARHPDIDIIACATDTIAAGAIEAVNELAREAAAAEVPFSKPLVSGFGDNQLLRAVTGGIPTVHFGYMTSGIKGAEMLIDQLGSKNPVSVQLKLGFQLGKLEEPCA